MTNVIVNAIDVLGHEIDEGVVKISAAGIQYTGDSLMLPEYHEQELVAGSTTIAGVTPGKVVISIHWGINRTATFRVFIPDTDEITLAELSLQKYDSDPAVVSQVTDAAVRAEGAAVRAEDVAGAFGSLEGVEDLVQDASDSAQAASGSASAAASSAGSAADSVTEAGDHADAAASSATAAASSASAAETSATNADESEDVALDASAAAIVAAINVAQYTGTGFPNGKVAAPVGSIYTDLDATNGAIRWIKTSGTGNTGWVVEYGETPRRHIVSGFYSDPEGIILDSGTVIVSRTNSLVSLTLYNLKVDRGDETSLAAQMPAGFRPLATMNFPGVIGAGPGARMSVTSGGGVRIYGLTTATWQDHFFSLNWDTTDPWPTTLPGTPT